MTSGIPSTVSLTNLESHLFFAVVQDLSASDFGHLAQVSKACREAISEKQLWANLHEREGIPQVQGFPGEVRNYRRDYFTLLSMTYSRKIIEETLPLKMVGPIPRIRREVFARLYDQDPFEAGVSIGQNYIFVVVPGLVRTADDQIMQFALAQLRNLRYIPKQVEGAPSQGILPVFHQNSSDAVFEQCARGSDNTTVTLMRKHVVDQSRNKPFDAQTLLVEQHQMQVIDLLVRVVSDLGEMYLTGTCPDGQDPWTYARCSDPVLIDGRRYQSAIGGFAPGAGVDVIISFYVSVNVGVVPGVPAEVLPAIGP